MCTWLFEGSESASGFAAPYNPTFDATCHDTPKILHLNSYGAWKAAVDAMLRDARNLTAYAHNLRIIGDAAADAVNARLCHHAELQVPGVAARSCNASFLLARHALFLAHPDRIPHWNVVWHWNMPKLGLASLWHRFYR